ncbi:MAG: OsmC family protein [Chloroflexi bacterium]|nr:OsmC family protein [Chloroflexota bacterium]
MEARAIWQGDMSFLGSADTGFNLKMDSSEVTGGHDDGFRPTELLAIGTAGCTAMDVISILKKKRAEVTAFEVRALVAKAETHPKVFTRMHIIYKVTGRGIKPDDVERAIQLSEEKYCPCIAMFRQVLELTREIQIIKAQP